MPATPILTAPMANLTPELLLLAYRNGIFPMAEPENEDAVYWYAPDPRAILPLDGFRQSRSLTRVLKSGRFEVRIDTAFEQVMRECSRPRPTQPTTWISEEFIRVYTQLHQLGFAHSVECWQEDRLAGGLYGVSIGGAFMGESMFHRVTDASKVALCHLVQRMRDRRMTLLDVQFVTPHLRRFGVIQIPREEYESRLGEALRKKVSFL